MRARSIFMAAALLLAAGAGVADAIERKALPAFHVTQGDGTAVASSQLVPADQWLLIYVMPGSPSCDLLLAALKNWQSAPLLQRTIIIVGAQTEAAQGYMQQALPPELGALRWFADSQGEAWAALRLTGAPVIVGVKQGVMQWGISGVLNDPAALESVVKTWVGQ